MVLAAIGTLGVAGLALGIAAVVQAGSHDAADREARQQLAEVRQATAKYQDFQQACDDGYNEVLLGIFVPEMGLHLRNGETITDKDEFDITDPQVLLYVPRGPEGKEKMHLVAVEYLADADEVPDEMFSGVVPEDWDATPISDVDGLHAWIWHGNPDGVFEAFNPSIPTEGPVVNCPGP